MRGRAKNPKRAKPRDYVDLAHVTTSAEIARWYSYSHDTVIMAINTRKIAAKKVSNRWLVSIPSVIALWGDIPKGTKDTEVWN